MIPKEYSKLYYLGIFLGDILMDNLSMLPDFSAVLGETGLSKVTAFDVLTRSAVKFWTNNVVYYFFFQCCVS